MTMEGRSSTEHDIIKGWVMLLKSCYKTIGENLEIRAYRGKMPAAWYMSSGTRKEYRGYAVACRKYSA